MVVYSQRSKTSRDFPARLGLTLAALPRPLRLPLGRDPALELLPLASLTLLPPRVDPAPDPPLGSPRLLNLQRPRPETSSLCSTLPPGDSASRPLPSAGPRRFSSRFPESVTAAPRLSDIRRSESGSTPDSKAPYPRLDGPAQIVFR